MEKKSESKASKVATKVKWVLYSGIALNTMLLIAVVADTPKTPKWIGE